MEMNMQNHNRSRKMAKNMEQVIPEPQAYRDIRSKSASQFACLGLLFSALLLVGLAIQAQGPLRVQAQETNPQSGFLGDYYLKLQPDPKNSDLLIYWKSDDALKNANKFILDPVLVYLPPEA